MQLGQEGLASKVDGDEGHYVGKTFSCRRFPPDWLILSGLTQVLRLLFDQSKT